MKECSLEIYTDNIDKYTRKDFISFLSTTSVEINGNINNIMDSLVTNTLEVEYILKKIENFKDKVLKTKINIIISDFEYSSGKKKTFFSKEYPLGKEAHKVAKEMNKKIEFKWPKSDLESEVMVWLLTTFILVKCKGVLKDNTDNVVHVKTPYQFTMGKLSLAILRLKQSK